MQVLNALLALAALLCSGCVVSAHKAHKALIGGAVAGGAGAVGAGTGFLAGSHLGDLLAKHEHGWHGHPHAKHVLLPPKHIYLSHHAPVAHHGHPHPAPPFLAHDHVHAGPGVGHFHHPVHHLSAGHGGPVGPFVEPAPLAGPVLHLGPAPVVPAHGLKHPAPLYKGNLVLKKHILPKGHHFAVHGYQFSFGRRPTTILHKKHFFFHPSPVVVKPFFANEPAFIKGGPSLPAGPIVEGPVSAEEGPLVFPVGAPAPPLKEPPAVAGPFPAPADGGAQAPLIKILGPIFDAPLPDIGSQQAW